MGQDNRNECYYGINELAELGESHAARYVTTCSVGSCPRRSGRGVDHTIPRHTWNDSSRSASSKRLVCHLPRSRRGLMGYFKHQ